MMKHLLIAICVSALCTTCLLAALPTRDYAAAPELKLTFSAYPLGLGELPVPPRVECAQAGSVAVLRAKGWSSAETRTAFVYGVSPEGLQEKLALPQLVWMGTLNRHPSCILDNNHAFYAVIRYDEHGDYQSGPYYVIQEADTGRVADITPENVSVLPRTARANPNTGTPLYSYEQGLAFFIRDTQTGNLTLLQGTRELKNVQTILATACIGNAFDNGRLTRVVITNDGKAFAYVFKSGRLAPASRFNKLAQVFLKSKPNLQQTTTFYMANDLMVWRENGTRLVIADSSGNVFRPNSIDAIATRPDGSARTEKESDTLEDNRAPLADEGKSLPPDVFSRDLLVAPFDDKSIAVIDCDYQRVIVVSAK